MEGYTTELGKPMLPVKIIRIALPDEMKVSTVRVLDIKEESLDGAYIVFPAQSPQPIGINPATITFQPPDSTIYSSYIPYPSEYISFNRQMDLAGQNIGEISIYPIRYTGAERRLTLVTSITFSVSGTSGYQCGDYLSTQASEVSRDMYEQMVKDMVINPEDVQLRTSVRPQPLGVPPGDYDYVIITTIAG
jgi:hypothetical protein